MAITPRVSRAVALAVLGSGFAAAVGAAEAGIGSEPFRPPVAGAEANPAGSRFEKLDPRDTGLAFVPPLDLDHPRKYLYHSGFVCGGPAVGDIDGDGWADVFFAGGPGPNALFRQVAPFRFEEVTAAAGVGGGEAWASGSALADTDGDGDLDLYVCNYDAPNALYLNRGDGTFEEAAAAAGLDLVDASLMPSLCDYDRDGDLDLFVLTNRYYDPGGQPAEPPVLRLPDRPVVKPGFEMYYAITEEEPGRFGIDITSRPDRLFRNNGDGTYTDVSEAAGIHGPGHGLSATWWDYDGDGWPDLHVGNDFADPDRLYRNNRDGTFTDVAPDLLPRSSWFSMGADAADFNNDGRLDLVVLDMDATTHYRSKVSMGEMGDKVQRIADARPRQVMRNVLFLNTGAGRFLEVAPLAGVASTDWSWTAKFGDLDNDGWLDLFVTNGMARDFNHSDHNVHARDKVWKTEWDLYADRPERPEQNFAFRNTGGIRFEDRSREWGLDEVAMSYGAALADFDRDGALDLLVVNLARPASLYRGRAEGNAIRVRLGGLGANTHGIGARVTVEAGDLRLLRELSPMTGFLSCDEPVLHFGIGAARRAGRLTVEWPSGARQVFDGLEAGRTYTVEEPEGGQAPTAAPALTGEGPEVLFERSPSLLAGLAHRERAFDDFERQPLLPNRLSTLGPGMAWGDVDGDGRDDVYLGGAAGATGSLFVNRGGGRFSRRFSRPFVRDKSAEDMGCLFFDADGDGDADLFVVSGGVECEPGDAVLRDRLYLNNGNGFFRAAPEGALPDLRDSGGPAAAADFDRDGDLDLFVGGRTVPGRYPEAPASRLLVNDGGGVFQEAAPAVAPGLNRAGMVTGALWSDVDADGWVDLLLSLEWGPVRLFKNDGGRLIDRTAEAGLAGRTGWYSGIAGGDIDADGDIDYVVGNTGLNTKYHADTGHPEVLYYGDLDGSGRPHIVEAKFEGDTLLPRRGLSCSSGAMPSIRERLPTFHQFALASLVEVYSEDRLREARRLEVNSLESGVLINDGAGRFIFRPLPLLAQASPVFGSVLQDIDGDGHLDLILAQNFSGPQVETGPFNGGVGLLLRGRGDGSFDPVWPGESGIVLPGDGRAAASVDLDGDGRLDFVAAVNGGAAEAFLNRGPGPAPVRVRLRGRTGNPDAVGARITVLADAGRGRAHEVYAGSGYLSQSPPATPTLPGASPTEIEVRWPDGTTSRVRLPGGTPGPVSVAHPSTGAPG